MPITLFTKLIGTRWFDHLMDEIDELEIDLVCSEGEDELDLSVPLTEGDPDLHRLKPGEMATTVKSFLVTCVSAHLLCSLHEADRPLVSQDPARPRPPPSSAPPRCPLATQDFDPPTSALQLARHQRRRRWEQDPPPSLAVEQRSTESPLVGGRRSAHARSHQVERLTCKLA